MPDSYRGWLSEWGVPILQTQTRRGGGKEMTISGLSIFFIFSVLVFLGVLLASIITERKALPIVVGCVIIVLVLVGELFYYNCTAVGRREVIDERSNLSNGIERTINVYTSLFGDND